MISFQAIEELPELTLAVKPQLRNLGEFGNQLGSASHPEGQVACQPLASVWLGFSPKNVR